MLNKALNRAREAWTESDRRYHQKMKQQQLQQIYNEATSDYYFVADIVTNVISQNAATLGLMAPGYPNQIAIPNGVGVKEDGCPFFKLVLLRQQGYLNSVAEFKRAFQGALDQYCYGNNYPRLWLARVKQLSRNQVGLILTWGAWQWTW